MSKAPEPADTRQHSRVPTGKIVENTIHDPHMHFEVETSSLNRIMTCNGSRVQASNFAHYLP